MDGVGIDGVSIETLYNDEVGLDGADEISRSNIVSEIYLTS